MASTPSGRPDRTKAFNPTRKVRVVAKIRGFADSESSTAPWISVNKPNGEISDSVTISFGDSGSHKESYEVNYCYEQNEDNDLIFSREVKPLIFGVFEGCNSTVIACGATGSGKTFVIQGSDEKPGLATLAIAEILSMAEQNGNLVTVSFYEVYQEHVYDLLDPKQPTVSILEDKGKIQHKGLSQVPVKSVTEFHKLHASMCGLRKSVQKIASELPRRNHRGLIIHLVSPSKNDDICLVGKMNFVDLAGYEDARRKSANGLNLVESTKINRSIYAIHNVVYSLNANESHVPYRESKLTHMLKDSLGGLNRILMITCLNPSFCQDSVYMVSLASRSCLGINRGAMDSTKKAKSSTRPMVPSSHKKNFLPGSVSTTVKKHTASKVHLSEKKANCVASALKGRKLFDEAIHRTTSEKALLQASSLPDIVSTVEPLEQEEGKCISNDTNVTVLSEVENENPLAVVVKDIESTSPLQKEASPLPISSAVKTPIPNKDFLASEVSLSGEDHHEQDTSYVNGSTNALSFAEGDGMDKENQHFLANEGVSPPISSRLRELSNNLKLLCSSTSSYDQVSTEIVEPKTPIMEQSRTLDDRWDVADVNSPWGTFSMRSSGMKNSLVQEYLRFLNTADKEDLKRLKGIGEKRATYIVKLREESPEPLKSLDDLTKVGLSAKQIKGMMKMEAAKLFN
ncbi:kinesin-like protein KIN-10C isoform X1 [Quercus robur]|uniref:kinesin-like protein KIN-10C isoform X1 n=1 Tax=Quercus robur TaxID=38942 RepID=UPI002161D561|nr:kinesin-like protein KIN-10C isoform X1 [Quercus robur]